MQGSLNNFLIRIFVFLFFVLLAVIFLYPILQAAFLSNVYINSIIIISLLFGIAFCLYNLYQLQDSYSVLANFNIHKSPKSLKNQKGVIKNLIYEIYEKNGKYQFKSSRIKNILENIDMNLSGLRETSRYLVGLLVFLGLLGTFWGLLKTIGSVSNVIGGLGIDETNVASFFNSLKDGLTAPLDGMSIAFSSSLLGLAGSLILGFIDLQFGQAQVKFIQFSEKTIINNSSPDFVGSNNLSDSGLINSVQKIYDNLDNLVISIKESSHNQTQIVSYIKFLSEQLKDLAKDSKEQDKKLSNFLSTQLNTQTNISELSHKLAKEGVIDKKTKDYLKNIDTGINKLITKLKK